MNDTGKSDNMSFEEALQALEKTVKRLEDGTLGLEEAIKAYEEGARLKDICEEKLRQAKTRVEKISLADKSVDKSGGESGESTDKSDS